METTEKKQLIEEFKNEWKNMWHNRLDDKVRAEGIADKDYSALSIDRGTVIIATRKFKLLDFYELLQKHKLTRENEVVVPDPLVGGWGKFIRTTLVAEKAKRRRRLGPPELDKPIDQQLKKGGRGWLHFKR